MKKFYLLLLAVMFIISVAVYGPSPAQTSAHAASATSSGESAKDPVVKAWPNYITITTGSVGGAFYTLGGGMADMLNKFAAPKVPATSVSGGGTANVMMVAAGQADIGFSYSATLEQAAKGVEDFKGKALTNLRAIAFLYPLRWHCAVNPKDFPNAKTTRDLFGPNSEPKLLKMVPNKQGTGDSYIAHKVVGMYGTSLKELSAKGAKIDFSSYTEAVDGWRDGHTNVFTPISLIPVASIMEIQTFSGVKILSIEDETRNRLCNDYGLSALTIPGGSYAGQDSDVQTVGMNNILFTRTDFPEDVIYLLTKLLVEEKAHMSTIHSAFTQFDPATAWQSQNTGIPLHPGAERYYRDAGYVK
jgi:TRAP transporter TAXI family solute receptor